MAALQPRIGIALPQSPPAPGAARTSVGAFATRAEELGYHTLWAQEQILGRDPSFEPITQLAYAAAVTTSIRLATAVIVLPRRPIALVAKQLATLDRLSDGRLIAGVAIGDAPGRYASFGPAVDRRADRLVEGLGILRRLWSEPKVTAHGEFTTLDAAAMEPKPIQQPIPIYLGAEHAAALRRAVELADGWISPGGGALSSFSSQLALVRDALAEHPRAATARPFAIVKKVYVGIEDDASVAAARMLDWWTTHWGAADRAVASRHAGAAAVTGTPDQVASALRGLIDLGLDELALFPVYDEARHLETLATEVLPDLFEPMAHPRDASSIRAV